MAIGFDEPNVGFDSLLYTFDGTFNFTAPPDLSYPQQFTWHTDARCSFSTEARITYTG